MTEKTYKVGDKVLFVEPFVVESEIDNYDELQDRLTYGYAEEMAGFVGGAVGTVTYIHASNPDMISVDGWGYSLSEIMPVKAKKEKPAKAVKPLPVSNRPAYAVVKNRVIFGMFELREDARQAKASLGGKKAGAAIVLFKPVEEIR